MPTETVAPAQTRTGPHLRVEVGEELSVRDLGRILTALNQLYTRMIAVELLKTTVTEGSVLNNSWYRPGWGLLHFPYHGLAAAVERYDEVMASDGSSPQMAILEARISSPGFVKIDGSSEVLGKIVDIIHKGGLQKGELRAVVGRIEAETRLLNAQALKEEVEAMAAAVDVLQSVGLTSSEIRLWLQRDSRLSSVLGGPVSEIRELQATAVTGIGMTE